VRRKDNNIVYTSLRGSTCIRDIKKEFFPVSFY
jgi:hypothetical protein